MKGITKNGEQPSGPAKDDDPPDTFKHDSEGLVPKLEPEDMPDSGWKDLSAAQVSLSKDRALANDKYRIEVGLTRRTSSVIDNIKDQCLDLPCRPIRIERKKKELQDILDICSTLDFDRARCMLVEFLDNRLELPGGGIGRPPKWIDISKPYEIFDALQMIKANGMDAKMHRAYGQMRLCESVDAKASDRTALSKMKGNGSHIAAHLVVLEKLAKDHAGPMAEKERSQLCSNYRSEYYAGKRWLEMAKGFGGTGIALVFLCAGNFCDDFPMLVWLLTNCRNWQLVYCAVLDRLPAVLPAPHFQ